MLINIENEMYDKLNELQHEYKLHSINEVIKALYNELVRLQNMPNGNKKL